MRISDWSSDVCSSDLLIHDALAKKDLKAIVLRVDSPGGSVLAADQIRSALMDAKSRGIPIVASMGNVAASGGYWISNAADRIIAEPSTIRSDERRVGKEMFSQYRSRWPPHL